MPSFLSRVAQHLAQQPIPLRELTLILPSRRAALFLKKELVKHLQKPTFAPHISTIEDFMLAQMGFEAEDQTVLLFKLYEAYLQTDLVEHDSFDEFNKWGALLLADFNELDRYLIPAKDIFGYLSDVKRLENWNLQPEQHTPMLENYLRFWEILPDLYEKFTQLLMESKKVYQGLAYREASRKIEQLTGQVKSNTKGIYFIGFNALNQAEEKILLTLYQEKIAHFLWDVDAYYFEDKLHEAGKFLRKSPLVKQLRADENFHWMGNALQTEPKKINIIGAAGNNAQAAAANGLLEDIKDDEWAETALVLADEKLLIPILNNLNQKIPSLNITMGLPLADSPMTTFFEVLWQMLLESEISKEARYHHSQWSSLLNQPIVKRLLADGAYQNIKKELVNNRRIYASIDEVLAETDLKQLFNPVLGNMGVPAKKMEALRDLCIQLKPHFDPTEQFLQALHLYYSLFENLKVLFEEYPYVSDFKTAYQFYTSMVRQQSLDLYGEPLQGLQLMGMLETRTLDFKRVILTSLNEGVLPSGRSQNSMIPFEIKRKYGLPTYLEKDSVYAYHFYRLLQGAEDISLIYNNTTDGLGAGEVSRFVAQLLYEMPKVNPMVILKKTTVQPQLKITRARATVEKTPAVLTRLKEMAEQGFSPSALSMYITNPLEFYYERVLGAKETDVLNDRIGYDVQGTVVHEILEEFYQKSGEKAPWDEITFDKLEEALKDFDVEKAVVKKLNQNQISNLSSGHNLLDKEMLTMMIENFFAMEKTNLKQQEKIKLIALEQNLTCTYTFKENQEIRLHGNADRVQQAEGKPLEIIDYKTGFVDDQKLKLNLLNSNLLDPELSKPFQLGMYAYMYRKQHSYQLPLKTSVLSLRKAHLGYIPMQFEKNGELDESFFEFFEHQLHHIFSELFDPTIPFAERIISAHDPN